jgi:hypothetical protein
MARFKNIITGNIINVEDKGTITLVEKSDRYEAVKAVKKSDDKKADDKKTAE